MLLWGVWGVIARPVSTALPPATVNCLATFGLLPVLAILALSSRVRTQAFIRRGFWLAFAAGIVSSLGNIALCAAMAMGGKTAAVIPLTALSPLVTIVLALLFLGERVNRVQCVGIGLSLAAIVCFNVTSGEGLVTPWLAAALAPIVLWGLSALLQKMATAHASAQFATFAFLAGFVPVALATPLFQTVDWRVSMNQWGLLLLFGLTLGLGNLTVIFAYGAGGRASIVTPMVNLYSIITIPLAVLVLGERIAGREALGIALALLAVVALVRETPAGKLPADGELVNSQDAQHEYSRPNH
jgi:transporter family protein